MWSQRSEYKKVSSVSENKIDVIRLKEALDRYMYYMQQGKGKIDTFLLKKILLSSQVELCPRGILDRCVQNQAMKGGCGQKG